jgi:hypothetical protein
MSQAEILHSIMSNPGSPNETTAKHFKMHGLYPKPPGASRNSFKPLHHHLPQFKTTGEEMGIYHKLDVKNIMNEKDKIPSKWKTIPKASTKTKLARMRKEEKIPDITFDLNGDGFVSPHEYAIAKMFDFNLNNKLDTPEKAYCLKKLKEGFESKMYWDADKGLDQRIIQQNGKIITQDSEYGYRNSDQSSLTFRKTLPILQKERFNERKSMNEKVFENFLQKEELKKGNYRENGALPK